MLLCPLLLWEDVIRERGSAEPGTGERLSWEGRLKKREKFMEKAGFDKNGEIFLSVAPFSDTLGMLVVTSGKSRHPAVGSTEMLLGSCPGRPSFGERPARMKSGVQPPARGLYQALVGLDHNHCGMRMPSPPL